MRRHKRSFQAGSRPEWNERNAPVMAPFQHGLYVRFRLRVGYREGRAYFREVFMARMLLKCRRACAYLCIAQSGLQLFQRAFHICASLTCTPCMFSSFALITLQEKLLRSARAIPYPAVDRTGVCANFPGGVDAHDLPPLCVVGNPAGIATPGKVDPAR